MSGHAGKVGADHLARAVRVYVRQSTLHQTRVNTESLQRQYELVDRARELGWAAEQVRVIDVDLGMSGAQAADREGFQELVAEVGLGKVGLILGIEVSRLARRNADWYALLDLCTLTDTLIGDADGVYDPADYSDRLVLGLKGTISEAELHLIKGRLIAGLRHKAARGQLRINLPAGYDYGPDGQVVQSPDEAVRESVSTVFRRFFEFGSIRQVAMSLLADGLRLPRRRGPGRTEWAPPTYTGVHDLLVNPTYAGAFAYGRRQSARRVGPDGRTRTSIVPMPRDRWRVLILDHHQPYVSWAQHEEILAQVASNRSVPGQGGGAAREGRALLQGLVRCGRCGRKMHSAYSGARGRARRYFCDPREGQIGGRAECQGMGGRGLDEAVLAEVFRVLQPAALAATAKALAEAETAEDARLAVFRAAAEKAHYEAERARRQYDACEPENRLVARGLEAAWETTLRAAEHADTELATQQARRPTPLSEDELALLAGAGADLRAVFDAPSTTTRDRKLLLRTLITDVTVVVDTDAGTIQTTVNWQGGATSRLDPLPLRRQGQTFRVTDEDTVSLIRRLAAHYDDATIAAILARQHRRTATGLRFTRVRVANTRDSHGIPRFTDTVGPDLQNEPMLSVRQTATELGVSAETVYRWLADGFITGDKPTPGAPWRIRVDDALRAKITEDAPAGWLPLDQAARTLGVARQTVLHRVQHGELTAVHVRRGKRTGLRIDVTRHQTGLFD
ncbi:MAG: recombinase family protein [Dermatophilaceae bacterium]